MLIELNWEKYLISTKKPNLYKAQKSPFIIWFKQHGR